MLRLRLDPRRVARGLLAASLLLGAISLPMTLAELRLREVSWSAAALARRFSLDSEAALPAWFSTLLLLLAAGVVGLVAVDAYRRTDRWRRHWACLSLLLVALSVDEAAGFHELLIVPVRDLINAGGLLYFAWVVPGAALVLVLGFLFRGFVLALPPTTRRGVLAAAAVYVGGALGVELVEGALFERHGEAHVGYILAATVEEVAEMLGMVLFIHTIVTHLSARIGGIHISFARTGVMDPEASGSDRPGQRDGPGASKRPVPLRPEAPPAPRTSVRRSA